MLVDRERERMMEGLRDRGKEGTKERWNASVLGEQFEYAV
jgi:hypothetical protein